MRSVRACHHASYICHASQCIEIETHFLLEEVAWDFFKIYGKYDTGTYIHHHDMHDIIYKAIVSD